MSAIKQLKLNCASAGITHRVFIVINEKFVLTVKYPLTMGVYVPLGELAKTVLKIIAFMAHGMQTNCVASAAMDGQDIGVNLNLGLLGQCAFWLPFYSHLWLFLCVSLASSLADN